MILHNGQTIAISGAQLEALYQTIINDFQTKRITWNGQANVLLTTALAEVQEMAAGKPNIVIANELPDPTTPNTQYWVHTYDGTTLVNGRYIVMTDKFNVATLIDTSSTDFSDYYTKTEVDDLLSAKQDKITDAGNYGYNPADSDLLSGWAPRKSNKMKSINFASLWAWIIGRCSKQITQNSTDTEIPTALAVLKLVVPKTDRGDLAVKYATGTTAGLYNIGEYDAGVERRCVKFGKMVQLTFQLKGAAVANSANWTYPGVIQSPYRPVRNTPITVQVYNGSVNEAAGGVVKTDGTIQIWTNTKAATNNYQIRCNVIYEGNW